MGGRQALFFQRPGKTPPFHGMPAEREPIFSAIFVVFGGGHLAAAAAARLPPTVTTSGDGRGYERLRGGANTAPVARDRSQSVPRGSTIVERVK